MSARDVRSASRRRLAAALLALPVATAAAVVGSTASASPADAERIKVSDTKLTSTSQKVTISVDLGPLEKGKLGLTPPGGDKAVEVASGTGPKTLSYTMSLACPDYDGSCVTDGRKTPAANGKWTVTFGSRVLVLGSGSDTSFVVAAPPEAPKKVAASSSGDDVKVRWRKGAEPDLASYRVAVGNKAETMKVGRACDGESCTAKLPAPAGGGRTAVAVKATRDGHGKPMSSDATTTSANVPEPKPTRAGTSRLPGSHSGAGRGPDAGSGGSAGFPTPNLQPGGTLPAGWPNSGTPSSNPYPSFGVRPKVAPAASSSPASADRRAVRPLAYGQARGDTVVPVAMALVLVLAGGHVWLLSRSGRVRPVLAAGVHRARGRRRKK